MVYHERELGGFIMGNKDGEHNNMTTQGLRDQESGRSYEARDDSTFAERGGGGSNLN